MTRLTVACLCVAGLLVSRTALADLSGCAPAAIPAPALKGLQKAAKRETAEALDPATLFYCTDLESGLATVDTIPEPHPDGTESLSTLSCSGPMDSQRGWTCRLDHYQAIRVSPDPALPELRFEVGERASTDTTREYARRALALLNEPGRVAACPGTSGSTQTTESLRASLARRHGPYRLVISHGGFALMRVDVQVRYRSADPFNPRDQFQCWEEQTIEE
jgi:hypothetical protein